MYKLTRNLHSNSNDCYYQTLIVWHVCPLTGEYGKPSVAVFTRQPVTVRICITYITAILNTVPKNVEISARLLRGLVLDSFNLLAVNTPGSL